MTPTPLDVESDPRFPSGKWLGFWTDARIRGRPKMELLLTFRTGTITGEGRDRVGKFLIHGAYSTEDGKCRWHKKYVGQHDVYYQGFNEGKGIWGTWELSQPSAAAVRGGFHVWPEGQDDPDKRALHAEAELPVESKENTQVGEPAGVR